MLRLTSEIQFLKASSNYTTGYTFDFVNNIEIENNYENLTDTCKITIPRNINLDGKDLVIGENSEFKVGDKVIIKLGYDGTNKTAFIGYITNLSLNLPLEIECEDSAWLLKKSIIKEKKTYSSVTLQDLLKDIMPSTIDYKLGSDFKTTSLGSLRINANETVATVLAYLSKNFRIKSYFIDETLWFFTGLEYIPENRIDHTFKFEENIIDNDLTYQKEGDAKIRVTYKTQWVETVNGKKKTQRRQVTYPSANAEGSNKDYNVGGNKSENELYELAKKTYLTFAYEGYHGSFTTFGAPFVKATDGIVLQSDKLEERNNGKYLVRSVTRTFGMNGYRQKIVLGAKIG